MLRRILSVLTTSGLVALLLGPSAWAQSETSPAKSEGLQEVVVTAQKVTQNLQKTSAAVTAVSGEALAQAEVTDLRAAQMVIPAVRFQTEGNNTQVFVRGVGSNLDFAPLDPTVSTNFDGVFMPREGTSTGLFDMENIQVLPGPQGTLYGRSAIGGTVNVTFNRPSHDNAGRAELEMGNHNLAHAFLGQNVSLSNSLAMRIAGDYTYHNGYMTSGADSQNDWGSRLSFLYTPTDAFSGYLWMYSGHKRGHPPNLVNHGTDAKACLANLFPCILQGIPGNGVPRGSVAYSEDAYLTGDPWNDTRPGALAALAPFGQPRPEHQKYDNWVVGGQFDWKFSNWTATYIPSYLYLDADYSFWLGAILGPFKAHYNQVSNELRFASGGLGRWKLLGGLYQYNQRNSGYFALFPLNVVVSDVRYSRIEGTGVFGQATYSVSSRFRLIGGGRFSSDKRDANGFMGAGCPPQPPLPPPYGLINLPPCFYFNPTTTPPTLANPSMFPGGNPYVLPLASASMNPFTFHRSYTNVDWKVGLEYDLGASSMLYSTLQTAYSPGTYNTEPAAMSPGGDNGVKPAHMTALAVGAKNRFLNDTLQINAEAFYYRYRDLVQEQYDQSVPFNPLFNAQRVQTYGTQIDTLWRMSLSDQLSMSIGYTRARNEEFIVPMQLGGQNYNGFTPVYSPDWTVIGAYGHSFRFSTGASLEARVDGRYESGWWPDYVHNPGGFQRASAKGDAYLTYQAASNWNAGVWVKNFTNKAALAATAVAGVPGPATAYMEAPRTYGLRVIIDYK